MQLTDIGWIMQTGMLAAQVGVERVRADREAGRAADGYVAARVSGAVAAEHASVAASLRTRLIGAEAEISRLQELVDELRAEKAILVAGAADLLRDISIAYVKK